MPAAAEDDAVKVTLPRQHLRLVRPDDLADPAPERSVSGDQARAVPADQAGRRVGAHHHEHILIEPDEDRWRWRRKIRQNPRKLFFYRIAVGIAGVLLVCAGLATGPLPGPGGIPLVLLGLAVWSSEFEWAHKVMLWFKAKLHQFRQWSRPKQIAFWVAFFTCCGAIAYTYLLTLGIPGWMPDIAQAALRHLPGV